MQSHGISQLIAALEKDGSIAQDSHLRSICNKILNINF